jgi:hypothetical protein
MPSNPPTTSQSFGRTFIVAAAVLGVVAVAQLGAVTFALFTKKGVIASTGVPEDEKGKPPPPRIDVNNIPGPETAPEESLNTTGDPIAEAKPLRAQPLPPETRESPVAVPENPGVSASPPATGIGGVPPLAPVRPTPVPREAFMPKSNPRFTEIVEQGRMLRNSGDTAGALLKFREAALLEPNNALPIAETAFTYEKMSLPDKAAEQWRQILAMGDSAGVWFSAAQGKFSAAISDTARAVAAHQPAPIPEGKTLAISQPRNEDQNDGTSAKHFTLHVPIRARAGQNISVRDMKVFVLFYEKINGKDIVRTSANVSNHWENPPIDWTSGEETLEVTYDLPPNDGRGEPREYYGYIIRLYYQSELQDTQAQPASLNTRFPAEYQLPE